MDRAPISLSTKSRTPTRSVGDPPSLGRVDRVPRHTLKGSKRKSRSGNKGSRRRRGRSARSVGQRVIVSIFLITILVILATLAMWSDNRRQQGVISEFEELSKQRLVERVESRFKSPTEEQARAIVTAALGAKDEAAVLANFRLNGVAPADVLEYLREDEKLSGPGQIESWVGSVDFNNTLVESVLIKYTKGEKSELRIALLTPDELGVWRLDYESFALKCAPAWENFVSGDATEGIVRIWFSEDNYYNGPYINDAEWLCLTMARLENDAVLFGYCRRNSPQGEAITRIMQRLKSSGKKDVSTYRATLAISRAEGAEKRQFEINRVLAEDWLMTDKAFDGLPFP